jgi:NADH dehydrogenase
MSLPTKKSPGKKPPVQIVLIGNGNISLGVYRSLRKKLMDESSNISLTIITQMPYHVCYGLMAECITGVVDYENLITPIETCFKYAKHIWGHATAVNPALRQVQIKQANRVINIPYDHVVIDSEYFNDEMSDNKTPAGFTIQSAWDMLKTRRQLDHLVERAIAARDRIGAARILRICVGGSGISGIEMAAYMGRYLRQLCNGHESLSDVKPHVYLVTNDIMFSGYDYKSKLKNYVNDQLKAADVKIVYDKRIIRVNTDGAILHDGSFINCSLVYNAKTESRSDALNKEPLILMENSVPAIDTYNRLKGCDNIWLANAPGTSCHELMPAPANYISTINKGTCIARNIVRSLKNQPLLLMNPADNKTIGSLGEGYGFTDVSGFELKGWPAWLIRCLMLLFYMPSSNRQRCVQNYFQGFMRKKGSLSRLQILKPDPIQTIQFQSA